MKVALTWNRPPEVSRRTVSPLMVANSKPPFPSTTVCNPHPAACKALKGTPHVSPAEEAIEENLEFVSRPSAATSSTYGCANARIHNRRSEDGWGMGLPASRRPGENHINGPAPHRNDKRPAFREPPAIVESLVTNRTTRPNADPKHVLRNLNHQRALSQE